MITRVTMEDYRQEFERLGFRWQMLMLDKRKCWGGQFCCQVVNDEILGSATTCSSATSIEDACRRVLERVNCGQFDSLISNP